MSEAMDKETLAQVAGMIRRNCTPSPEAYQRGGDALIYAVADWVENPPEWVLALSPAPSAAEVAEDALDDLRESIEQEMELGGDTSTLVPAVTEWLKRWPVSALSTQPAAGEVEWGWRHDIGGLRTTTSMEAAQLLANKYNGTVMSRTIGPWVEAQPEPQPTELANLFPGTLAALDNLNIRPEAQ